MNIQKKYQGAHDTDKWFDLVGRFIGNNNKSATKRINQMPQKKNIYTTVASASSLIGHRNNTKQNQIGPA